MSRDFLHACAVATWAALPLLAVSAPSAHAQTAPVTVTVLSTESTSGSFGLSISGANEGDCSDLASRVQVSGATLTVHALPNCNFEFMPSATLAPGRYCITIPSFGGTLSQACFKVTGLTALIDQVAPSIEDVGPDAWVGGSCRACTNPELGNACTRSLRQRSVRLHLDTGATELAAQWAFAVVPVAEGSTGEMPTDEDFFLVSDRLVTTSVLDQREDASRPCLHFYARSFGGKVAISLGTACIDSKLPNTVPAAYTAPSESCDCSYRTRWCADNAADCTGSSASSFTVCASYADTCSQGSETCTQVLDAGTASASLDAGEPDAGDVAARDARADASPALDASLDTARPDDPKGSSGCALSSSDRSEPGWLLFALIALSRRRTRPVRDRTRA